MPYLEGIKTTKYVYKCDISVIIWKDISNFIMESETQSKVEDIELRGSRWGLVKCILLTVLFSKSEVAKRASNVKLPIKNQAKVIIQNKKKDNLCGIYSTLAFIHPSRDHPNRLSVNMNYLYEIETNGIDLTDGLKLMLFKI